MTATLQAVPTNLTEVEAQYPPAGRVFPHHLLKHCDTAIVMFAAGFYGLQDALWIARRGLDATCIDIDTDKLATMLEIYPSGWTFANADAFDVIADCDQTFDLLTADAPTLMSDRCIDELPLLLSVTNRAALISVHKEMNRWGKVTNGLDLPEPWQQTDLVYRTSNYGGCYWLQLERQP